MSDPEPSTAQDVPGQASTLLNVSWRAWRLFGREWGPRCSTVLRLALVTGGPPIIERVDGRPLGVIAQRCREAIDEALAEMRERIRVQRGTARHLRANRPITISGTEPPPEVRASAAPAEAKTGAIAKLVALRALQATRRSEDGVMTPFDAVPSAPDAETLTDPPGKRSSSVFRCDREVITDRISKLRRKADGSPAPPTGEGGA